LVSLGILQKPTLYISEFFEKHRPQYYDGLSRVRESGDMEHWVRFFLTGVIETARKSRDTLERVIDLRKKYEDAIETHMTSHKQKQAKALLQQLYSQPIVSIRDVEKMLSVTFPTASRLVYDLGKIGLFTSKEGIKKDRLFYFGEYLDLFIK
jgi:Fic family protein